MRGDERVALLQLAVLLHGHEVHRPHRLPGGLPSGHLGLDRAGILRLFLVGEIGLGGLEGGKPPLRHPGLQIAAIAREMLLFQRQRVDLPADGVETLPRLPHLPVEPAQRLAPLDERRLRRGERPFGQDALGHPVGEGGRLFRNARSCLLETLRPLHTIGRLAVRPLPQIGERLRVPERLSLKRGSALTRGGRRGPQVR